MFKFVLTQILLELFFQLRKIKWLFLEIVMAKEFNANLAIHDSG